LQSTFPTSAGPGIGAKVVIVIPVLVRGTRRQRITRPHTSQKHGNRQADGGGQVSNMGSPLGSGLTPSDKDWQSILKAQPHEWKDLFVNQTNYAALTKAGHATRFGPD